MVFPAGDKDFFWAALGSTVAEVPKREHLLS